MSKKNLTYNDYKKYLANGLTEQDKHGFEKKMMQDAFETDAFDGLHELDADTLNDDINELRASITNRTSQETKSYSLVFKIAATVVILAGLFGVYFLIQNVNNNVLQGTELADGLDKKQEPKISDEIPMVEEQHSQELEGEVLLHENEEIAEVVEPESRAQITDEIEDETIIQKKESQGFLARKKEAVALKVSKREGNKNLKKEPTQLSEEFYASGIITDENGQPLPGVSVTDPSTNRSAITNLEGEFKIAVEDSTTKLHFGYIGFIPEERIVNNDDAMVLALSPDSSYLNMEVVAEHGLMLHEDNNITTGRAEATNLPIKDDESITQSVSKGNIEDRGMTLSGYNKSMFPAASKRKASIEISRENNFVNGVVYDENNSPIPGVTLKGNATNKSVITDLDGKFYMELNDSVANIQVTHEGFNTKHIYARTGDRSIAYY